MKAIGERTKCMGKDFTNGQMEDSMKATMLTTKKKASEFTLTLTEDVIRDSGQTRSSMEKVSS